MRLPSLAVLALFVVFAPAVVAQPQAATGSAGGSAPTRNNFQKGAPFSADTIMLFDLVLRSGKHRRSETHGRICRDSQGRTYVDDGLRFRNEPGLPPITITDLGVQTLITLDPLRKIARISDTEPHPPTATFPPHEPRQRRTVKVEDLGTQVIEGLTVKGTRTTSTYTPEGEPVSPDNAFIVTEWFSDELQIPILQETVNGTRSSWQSKEVNIVRAEPDESMFQIPQGYKVFDRRTPGGKTGSQP